VRPVLSATSGHSTFFLIAGMECMEAMSSRCTKVSRIAVQVHTRVLLAAFALLGVPAAFAVFLSTAYRIALEAGRLPFAFDRIWLWYAAFAVLLALGSLATFLAVTGTVRLRLVLVVLYAFAMSVALLVTALFTSCAMGDCL